MGHGGTGGVRSQAQFIYHGVNWQDATLDSNSLGQRATVRSIVCTAAHSECGARLLAGSRIPSSTRSRSVAGTSTPVGHSPVWLPLHHFAVPSAAERLRPTPMVRGLAARCADGDAEGHCSWLMVTKSYLDSVGEVGRPNREGTVASVDSAEFSDFPEGDDITTAPLPAVNGCFADNAE